MSAAPTSPAEAVRLPGHVAVQKSRLTTSSPFLGLALLPHRDVFAFSNSSSPSAGTYSGQGGDIPQPVKVIYAVMVADESLVLYGLLLSFAHPHGVGATASHGPVTITRRSYSVSQFAKIRRDK